MKAVITGDIIKSTYISDHAKMIRSLKLIMQRLVEHGYIRAGSWEIFRGDSFQLVTEPEKALLAALILRSGFRGGVYRFASPLVVEEMLDESIDVRLSIGIGSVGELTNPISESYGEAFTLSGKMLETITDEGLRLIVVSPDEQLNAHFDMICRLLDVIINDWSENSSQAIYRNLLAGETQRETAEFLGISQSSVQNRLKIAHMDEIHYLLSYFKDQILQIVQ
ncbi:MAG: SatD family protein [Bacteroidales bacterium]|nr:SatD family protein [Bacteroidales bacterium]